MSENNGNKDNGAKQTHEIQDTELISFKIMGDIGGGVLAEGKHRTRLCAKRESESNSFLFVFLPTSTEKKK